MDKNNINNHVQTNIIVDISDNSNNFTHSSSNQCDENSSDEDDSDGNSLKNKNNTDINDNIKNNELVQNIDVSNDDERSDEADSIKMYREQLKIDKDDHDDDFGTHHNNTEMKNNNNDYDNKTSYIVRYNDVPDQDNHDDIKSPTFNKADYTIDLFFSVINNKHRNKNRSVLIDYEIKEVDGKGRGIFAAGLIPKGTPIKRYEVSKSSIHFIELNEKECREILSKLNYDDARLFLSYVCAYKPWIHENKEEVIVFDGDDLMFCNHSRDGNMVLNWSTWTYYAGHDIQKGEEIAEDYGHYEDPLWLTKINREYGLFDLDTLVKTLNSGGFEHLEDNSLKPKDE